MKNQDAGNKTYKMSIILACISMLLMLTLTMLAWYSAKNTKSLFMLIIGIGITLFLSVMISAFSNSELRVEKHAKKRVLKMTDINDELNNLSRDWKTTLNSMDDGIIIVDKQNNILEINEAFRRILGDKQEMLIGSNYYEVFQKVKDPVLNCPFEKVKEKGGIERAEVFEPGINKWFSVTLSPVLGNKGELTRVVQIIRDITDSKKAKETLREFTEEIYDLYNNAPFGYHSADADGTIVRINDTTIKWLGYTREEIVGKMKSTDFLTPSSAEKIEKLFPKMKEGGRGKLENVELEVKRKDGSTFFVLASSTVLRDKTGNFLIARTSILDITKYNKVVEELKTAMEIKSAFTSMVSHELRTPLTSIKEGLGIVLDGSAGAINDEQKRFLELAKRNVDRLHRLINNVLDFTKLNTGELKYNFKEENLNKLVKDIAETYEPVLAKKGLYVRTELEKEMPQVIMDSDKISQVINNLLNNAEKFTEHGGITVKTGYEIAGKQAVVKIIDTGQGIKKEDIGKIFKEFTTVGTRRMLGSTGLGLAICQQIIQGHFGKIYAESEPGKGSVFTFVLPVKVITNA